MALMLVGSLTSIRGQLLLDSNGLDESVDELEKAEQADGVPINVAPPAPPTDEPNTDPPPPATAPPTSFGPPTIPPVVTDPIEDVINDLVTANSAAISMVQQLDGAFNYLNLLNTLFTRATTLPGGGTFDPSDPANESLLIGNLTAGDNTPTSQQSSLDLTSSDVGDTLTTSQNLQVDADQENHREIDLGRRRLRKCRRADMYHIAGSRRRTRDHDQRDAS